MLLLTAGGLLAPAPLATLHHSLGAEPPPLAFVVANRLIIRSPNHTQTLRLDLGALPWDESPLPAGFPLDVRLYSCGGRLTLWGARLDTLFMWATDDDGPSWRRLATEPAAEGRVSRMLPLSDGRLLWGVERLDVEEADGARVMQAAQTRLAAAPGADLTDLPSVTLRDAISAALPLPGGQALLLGGEHGAPEEGIIS